jgi:chromosome segregation ATPase
MKKSGIYALLLAAFLAVSGTPVYAKSTPSPTPSTTSNSLREVRQAAPLKGKALSDKQKKDSERKSQIAQFWKKTGERLQVLIGRERSVAEKIDTRLSRLSTAGRDASKLKTDLAGARAKVDAAQAAVDAAAVELKAMADDGKSTADILTRARELHDSVIAKIRDGHAALIDVLAATRGLSVAPTASPTATP